MRAISTAIWIRVLENDPERYGQTVIIPYKLPKENQQDILATKISNRDLLNTTGKRTFQPPSWKDSGDEGYVLGK